MQVTDLPWNRLVGLFADEQSLTLPAEGKYLNHVGTVAAGALFSLAEAASGAYLLAHVGTDAGEVVGVVRDGRIKYRKPSKGRIRSRANCAAEVLSKMTADLAGRGRSMITVDVELIDDDGEI